MTIRTRRLRVSRAQTPSTTRRFLRRSLLGGGLATLGLWASLVWATPAPPDRIDPALEARLRGRARLDDVRVEASLSRDGKMTSVRVYGNGVGIFNKRTQFRLTRNQVRTLLKTLRAAHFGAMPDWYGEAEGAEENERERESSPGSQDSPNVKGRVAVRVGEQAKTVIQLTDGDQSPEFAALAQRLLDLCAEPARTGVGAVSLSDGLRKLAAGELAPETLSMTVQVREDPQGPGEESGWILHLEGRRALAEILPSGKRVVPSRLWIIPSQDFGRLAGALADAHTEELPINLYAQAYTDLRVEVLQWSRAISARRFLQMTPTTRGAAQETFDRLVESLGPLIARARREGKALSAAPSPSRPRERSEKEEERERDRE